MIVLSYAGQYDIELGSFGFELLQDDAWIARMLSEARLVVVTSWSDLIGRAVFSLGVLAATYNMKELLAWTPRRGQRIVSMHNIGPDTEPLRLVGSLRLQVIDKRSHPGKLQKTVYSILEKTLIWFLNTRRSSPVFPARNEFFYEQCTSHCSR